MSSVLPFDAVWDLERPVHEDDVRRRSVPEPLPDIRECVRLAISCCDLTTLEAEDTEEKITRLAGEALRPSPEDENVPSVAALCTWTRLIGVAAPILDGSGVRLAAVAGDFPLGRASTDEKVGEIESALASGAEEIDTVVNRKLLLDGDAEGAYDELVALKAAAGSATLKVILETGELADLRTIREGALIALAAGADFVKTSTGKMAPGATPEAAVVLCDAIKDFYARFARPAGLKVAGGIRTTEDALVYLQIVRGTLGEEWLEPRRFRIGASSLVKDLVAHL